MADTTYDTDIVTWSETQADRLRRLRDGEQVNDLDWDHVIEEIEDVGRSQRRGVESLWLQAFIHALMIIAWPDHAATRKWQNEMAVFLADARRRFEPGMAQHLDPGGTFADARATVLQLGMGRPPGPLPETLAVSVTELTDRGFTADALIRRLRG